MTVYRTSDDTPLIPALIRATENGKQAVCLVELKARFDERANIGWARALEEAGVHVVYGHPSLKTHAKSILVVRREGDGVRHYVHVGTGNYNLNTARLYTDFGLFTADPRLGVDVGDMFNFLTGFARPRRYNKVLLAPTFLRDSLLDEIERTIAAHERGEDARILMKMNSLVDRRCIRALYQASQAGVPVDLNIRGICCLRPGVPGVSDNIRVVSVLGRFLEHSRVYAFFRGDEVKVYTGSADLMPRNLDTRVELIVPGRGPRRARRPPRRGRALPRRRRGRMGPRSGAHLGAAHAGPGAPRRAARAHDRARGARSRGARDARRRRRPSPGSASTRRRAATGGSRSCSRRSTPTCRSRGGGTPRASTRTRLHMNDHSWVHIQIVLNIALRLARLLFRAGVTPSIVEDHGMKQRDAEVVIAAAALLHCVGMSVHRTDHETYSLFLCADKLPKLLEGIYDEPERTIIVAEAMHAVISHRSRGNPLTIEAAIVRVADALDMAKGRSRVEVEAGRTNIHAVSSYAIDEVRIGAGDEKAVRVEVDMNSSAGIFQVDEGLGTKLRGTPLAEHVEVVARIEAEHEERLVPVFRL